MKNILISFFNLCFPPKNQGDKPKIYKLILFYFLMFFILPIILIYLPLFLIYYL